MHINSVRTVFLRLQIVTFLVEADFSTYLTPWCLLSEQVLVDLHDGDVPLITFHFKGVDFCLQVDFLFLADTSQLDDHTDEELDRLC